MFKEMLRRLEQQNNPKPDESVDVSGNRCKHLRREEDGGTVFCADCGLVFEDEVVYLSEYHNTDYHHPRDRKDTEEHTPATTKAEPKPTPTPTPCGRASEGRTEPTTATTTAPKSVKDLIKIAKERGIKYRTKMSKKDLCMVLGLEISKPIKYLFKNKETGEEHGFHSIYLASKEMGINPGLVAYHLGKEMTIGGVKYAVRDIDIQYMYPNHLGLETYSLPPYPLPGPPISPPLRYVVIQLR